MSQSQYLPQRILVTGGAGFIASHTIDLLLAHDIEVIALDNLTSGKLTHLNINHPKLKFINGDIRDYSVLAEQVNQCEAVLHLAAIASVPQSIADPVTSLQVNTQGFLHVLEAVAKTKRKIPIVYASSAAVYGDGGHCSRHEHEVCNGNALLSPYAIQKRHCEQYADLYARLFGIYALGLRYFNVYGSRQDPQSPYSGVICKFIKAYQHQLPLKVFGDGQQSRDFIHVSDIARANIAALEKSINLNTSEVVNIGTGQAQSLMELIRCIERAGHKTAQIEFLPQREGDIQISYAAIELAKQMLQFEAQVTLQDGIALML